MPILRMALLIMVEPVAAFVDPVGELNQLLMLAVMVIAIMLAIRYRANLIFMITGDDHVHVSVLGMFWFVGCRCFGLCDGSWTKYVSWALCCCCPSMRGLNLKRVLGQALGVVPIPVRLTNIAVGDIPAYGISNFFLSVEVGENPTQITSIQEDVSPKVIQFEEDILIRIRYAPVEPNVRFCVRELTVFGNRELCECFISPMAIIAWKFADRGPMRFRMDPIERNNDFIFPAWILMEMQPHPEWTAPGNFSVRLTDYRTQVHHDIKDAAVFKYEYHLVNNVGVKSEEPDERKVGRLSEAKICQGNILKNILLLKVVILLLFFTGRFYMYNCKGTYVLKEVLRRANEKFPVPQKKRDWFSVRCKLPKRTFFNMIWQMSSVLVGEGVEHARRRIPGVDKLTNVSGVSKFLPKTGNTTASSYTYNPNSTIPKALWECTPTHEDVSHTCYHLPFGAQPATFDISLGFTTVQVPCDPHVCHYHKYSKITDVALLVVIAFLFFLACITKAVFGVLIRRLQADAFEQSF